MATYYFNPNHNEVHELDRCAFQDNIKEWLHLGIFPSIDEATAHAKRILSRTHGTGITRCMKCVDAVTRR